VDPGCRGRRDRGAGVHALHPVVLGADNTRFTADYPGEIRRRIEARIPVRWRCS